MLLDIGVRLSAVLLAAWIGARWLTAPMCRLAKATQELARDIHHAPLAEEGTRECREASIVINQLQKHIQVQLGDRDQFVAAVSHDLRTPLTRLALRVQSLESEVDRERFGKDICEMDRMIRATRDYFCGATNPEAWVDLDWGSLVDSQVQDSQECGYPVTRAEYAPLALHPIHIKGQISAIRRCIDNLTENAIRYGGNAEIAIVQDNDTVRVVVTDNGPGIPEESLTKVLLPFYHVEFFRNRDTGGVGLGLATVNNIARRHGGSLVLANRVCSGLRAELIFPCNKGCPIYTHSKFKHPDPHEN